MKRNNKRRLTVRTQGVEVALEADVFQLELTVSLLRAQLLRRYAVARPAAVKNESMYTDLNYDRH